MTKRMLIDAAHPEQTRVAIVSGNRLEDLDVETASRRPNKGNIFLAKVMHVEPSLQAVFVEYGGTRHGFLAFAEIHPDYYRIPIADRDTQGFAESESFGHSAAPHLSAPMPAPIEPTAAPLPGERVVHDLPVAGLPPVIETTSAPLCGHTGNFVPTQAQSEMLADLLPVAPAPSELEEQMNGMATSPIETVGGGEEEEAEEVRREAQRRPRPRDYKVQEVIKRGQIMLVQVVKEERGNKGAAMTTYLSLAGRYCVLMPNTDEGGGISRKVMHPNERRAMKEAMESLGVPEGMSVILRTAGVGHPIPEVRRDFEYLVRLWDNIRQETLRAIAPAMIYEEANLIKRAIRDMYTQDIDEVLVEGKAGHELAEGFMTLLTPGAVQRVRLYNEPEMPLFYRFQVESQIEALHDPVVALRSGGYLVINPTEALVAIDVNSGRATRERHIEETAFKTNLEAAEEVARQLRLRDLAGLIVIDFIDMEDGRNNAAVERRLKESMRGDRARLQIGRISPFGLLELSRQRLRPSLLEAHYEKCPHCAALGYVRLVDSAALSILRAVEEEATRHRAAEIVVHAPVPVVMYLLNQKRSAVISVEDRYGLSVTMIGEAGMPPSQFTLEKLKTRSSGEGRAAAVSAVTQERLLAEMEDFTAAAESVEGEAATSELAAPVGNGERRGYGPGSARGGRGGGRSSGGSRGGRAPMRGGAPGERPPRPESSGDLLPVAEDLRGPDSPVAIEGAQRPSTQTDEGDENGDPQRRRRRGRRGGRRRRNGGEGGYEGSSPNAEGVPGEAQAAGGESQSQGVSRAAPALAPAPMPVAARPARVPPPTVRAPMAPPPAAPISVFDLDTTPRLDTPGSPASESADSPSGPPKTGWWRRLTGV